MRRIQKTIQVTRPTEMIDSEPPRASWASKDSWEEPNCRTAPKAIDSSTAAPTPVHTGGSFSRRPVLTR